MINEDLLKLFGVASAVYVILFITYNFVLRLKDNRNAQKDEKDFISYMQSYFQMQNQYISELMKLQTDFIRCLGELKNELVKLHIQLEELSKKIINRN